MRKFCVGVAALGLGVAGAVLPSLAASEGTTPLVRAQDYAFAGPDGHSTVTVPVGGQVEFSYPSGFSAHNVNFGSGATGITCTQSAGANSGSVPPLPHTPSLAGWDGTCTFSASGTYSFICDQHAQMTGSIVVGDGSSTTGTTTTTDPPARPTARALRSALVAVRLAAAQRGTVVRGSVRPPAARLSFTAELRLAGRSVGRLRSARVGPGRVSFAVPLTASGRALLRSRGQLSLSLRLTLAVPGGASAVCSRSVRLTAG
jgi:plastocyanin